MTQPFDLDYIDNELGDLLSWIGNAGVDHDQNRERIEVAGGDHLIHDYDEPSYDDLDLDRTALDRLDLDVSLSDLVPREPELEGYDDTEDDYQHYDKLSQCDRFDFLDPSVYDRLLSPEMMMEDAEVIMEKLPVMDGDHRLPCERYDTPIHNPLVNSEPMKDLVIPNYTMRENHTTTDDHQTLSYNISSDDCENHLDEVLHHQFSLTEMAESEEATLRETDMKDIHTTVDDILHHDTDTVDDKTLAREIMDTKHEIQEYEKDMYDHIPYGGTVVLNCVQLDGYTEKFIDKRIAIQGNTLAIDSTTTHDLSVDSQFLGVVSLEPIETGEYADECENKIIQGVENDCTTNPVVDRPFPCDRFDDFFDHSRCDLDPASFKEETMSVEDVTDINPMIEKNNSAEHDKLAIENSNGPSYDVLAVSILALVAMNASVEEIVDQLPEIEDYGTDDCDCHDHVVSSHLSDLVGHLFHDRTISPEMEKLVEDPIVTEWKKEGCDKADHDQLLGASSDPPSSKVVDMAIYEEYLVSDRGWSEKIIIDDELQREGRNMDEEYSLKSLGRLANDDSDVIIDDEEKSDSRLEEDGEVMTPLLNIDGQLAYNLADVTDIDQDDTIGNDPRVEENANEIRALEGQLEMDVVDVIFNDQDDINDNTPRLEMDEVDVILEFKFGGKLAYDVVDLTIKGHEDLIYNKPCVEKDDEALNQVLQMDGPLSNDVVIMTLNDQEDHIDSAVSASYDMVRQISYDVVFNDQEDLTDYEPKIEEDEETITQAFHVNVQQVNDVVDIRLDDRAHHFDDVPRIIGKDEETMTPSLSNDAPLSYDVVDVILNDQINVIVIDEAVTPGRNLGGLLAQDVVTLNALDDLITNRLRILEEEEVLKEGLMIDGPIADTVSDVLLNDQNGPLSYDVVDVILNDQTDAIVDKPRIDQTVTPGRDLSRQLAHDVDVTLIDLDDLITNRRRILEEEEALEKGLMIDGQSADTVSDMPLNDQEDLIDDELRVEDDDEDRTKAPNIDGQLNHDVVDVTFNDQEDLINDNLRIEWDNEELNQATIIVGQQDLVDVGPKIEEQEEVASTALTLDGLLVNYDICMTMNDRGNVIDDEPRIEDDEETVIPSLTIDYIVDVILNGQAVLSNNEPRIEEDEEATTPEHRIDCELVYDAVDVTDNDHDDLIAHGSWIEDDDEALKQGLSTDAEATNVVGDVILNHQEDVIDNEPRIEVEEEVVTQELNIDGQLKSDTVYVTWTNEGHLTDNGPRVEDDGGSKKQALNIDGQLANDEDDLIEWIEEDDETMKPVSNRDCPLVHYVVDMTSNDQNDQIDSTQRIKKDELVAYAALVFDSEEANVIMALNDQDDCGRKIDTDNKTLTQSLTIGDQLVNAVVDMSLCDREDVNHQPMNEEAVITSPNISGQLACDVVNVTLYDQDDVIYDELKKEQDEETVEMTVSDQQDVHDELRRNAAEMAVTPAAIIGSLLASDVVDVTVNCHDDAVGNELDVTVYQQDVHDELRMKVAEMAVTHAPTIGSQLTSDDVYVTVNGQLRIAEEDESVTPSLTIGNQLVNDNEEKDDELGIEEDDVAAKQSPDIDNEMATYAVDALMIGQVDHGDNEPTRGEDEKFLKHELDIDDPSVHDVVDVAINDKVDLIDEEPRIDDDEARAQDLCIDGKLIHNVVHIKLNDQDYLIDDEPRTDGDEEIVTPVPLIDDRLSINAVDLTSNDQEDLIDSELRIEEDEETEHNVVTIYPALNTGHPVYDVVNLLDDDNDPFPNKVIPAQSWDATDTVNSLPIAKLYEYDAMESSSKDFSPHVNLKMDDNKNAVHVKLATPSYDVEAINTLASKEIDAPLEEVVDRKHEIESNQTETVEKHLALDKVSVNQYMPNDFVDESVCDAMVVNVHDHFVSLKTEEDSVDAIVHDRNSPFTADEHRRGLFLDENESGKESEMDDFHAVPEKLTETSYKIIDVVVQNKASCPETIELPYDVLDEMPQIKERNTAEYDELTLRHDQPPNLYDTLDESAHGRLISSTCESLPSVYQLNTIIREKMYISKKEIDELLIKEGCSYLSRRCNDAVAWDCLRQILCDRVVFSPNKRDIEATELCFKASLDSWEKCNPFNGPNRINSMIGLEGDETCLHSLESLRDFAVFYASLGDWSASTEVLHNLLLKCEHNMPPHHPLAISTLLDLASISFNTNDEESAIGFTDRCRRHLTQYFGEQFEFYRTHHIRLTSGEANGNQNVLSHEEMIDNLNNFEAYIHNLRTCFGRSLRRILGSDHPIYLLSLCFIADAFTALANCDEIIIPTVQGTLKSSSSHLIWKHAGEYYRLALDGWIRAFGVTHPSVPAMACSLARCLRKTNNSEESVQLLNRVVDAFYDMSQGQPRASGLSNAMTSASHHAIAECLWLLAAYSSENKDSLEGRRHALGYLYAASKELRRIDPECMSDSELYRSAQMLHTIEFEAKLIFSLPSQQA